MSALDVYFTTLTESAEAIVGSALSAGTVVVPEADRIGSRSATSYPLPSGTTIWCDPALTDLLGDVLGGVIGGGVLGDVLGDGVLGGRVTERAIDSEEFVRLATAAGASLSGFGNNRVLVGEVARFRDVDGGVGNGEGDVASRVLDPADADDLAALADLVDAASEEDLDEADLDLDDLDPFIVGLFDGDTMVAYCSARPSELVPPFDDIAVLTHPAHRRRGLGARIVADFVDLRRADHPERQMLYRCTVENLGSNALASSLGFTFAHTIGAVRFP